MRTRTHVSRFADCHVCELASSLARFASPRPCPPGRSGVSAVPSSTWRSLHPQRAARNGWATHGHSSVDDRDVLLDCPGPDACCLAAALQPSFLPRQASPSKPQKAQREEGGSCIKNKIKNNPKHKTQKCTLEGSTPCCFLTFRSPSLPSLPSLPVFVKLELRRCGSPPSRTTHRRARRPRRTTSRWPRARCAPPFARVPAPRLGKTYESKELCQAAVPRTPPRDRDACMQTGCGASAGHFTESARA